MDTTQRSFLQAKGTVLGAAAVTRAGAATLPEAPTQKSAATQPPLSFDMMVLVWRNLDLA